MKTRTLTVWRDNPPPGPRYFAEIEFEKIDGRWIPMEADRALEWALEKDAYCIGRYLNGIRDERRYHIDYSWNLGRIERSRLKERLS